MQKAILFIACFLLYVAVKAQTDTTVAVTDIYLTQNGKRVEMNGNTCTLKRKPFEIVVAYKNIASIGIHASFQDSTYSQALNKKIEIVTGYSKSKNRYVYIDNWEGGYLFAKKPFDKIDKTQNKKTRTYTIKSIPMHFCKTSIDRRGGTCILKHVSIKRLKQDLYLLFAGYNKDGIVEYSKCIKIEWAK